jgi:hypothetical protein
VPPLALSLAPAEQPAAAGGVAAVRAAAGRCAHLITHQMGSIVPRGEFRVPAHKVILLRAVHIFIRDSLYKVERPVVK